MTEQIDPKQFRNVMGQAPTCVTVVTAVVDEAPQAMVIGSFVSVSLEPPLAGFFCTTGSSTWAELRKADKLGVNVLGADQEAVSNACMRAGEERYDDLEWSLDNGAPRFPGTSAWLVLSIKEVIDAGDHEFALCNVEHLEAPEAPVEPLVFYGGKYRQLAPLD